jgi:hypothetical protein
MRSYGGNARIKARKKKKLLMEAWMRLARKLPACFPTAEDQKAWAVENCNRRIDDHRQKKRHRERRMAVEPQPKTHLKVVK